MPADKLFAVLAASQPDIFARAARLDESPAFPSEDFKPLIEAGLLRATLPKAAGGMGMGQGEAGGQSLLRLLAALGQASLPLARLYEAHVNALQLTLRYGTPALAECCTRDALDGKMFGLWVTDQHGAALRLQAGGDGFTLFGRKDFCSGAGAAQRALITATTETGVQMLIVNVENARVVPSGIKLSGMRAAITGSVDFSGMPVSRADLLGAEGDYLREPVFSAGAWRGSAAALGGLIALVEQHRREIAARRRDADPHQRARFGQLLITNETARLWMQQAASRACLEDGSAAQIVAYVNLARIAVETACLDAMRLTQRSLGLGAFIAGHPAERICRDLAVFLRQPAPDETLDKAAAYYFDADLPGRE